MYTCYSGLPMKKVSFYARNFSGNSAILSSDKYISTILRLVRGCVVSSALNANYNSLMSQKETLKSLWKREESNLYKKKVMAENPVIIENVVFDCKRWVSYVVRHFPPKWLKSYTTSLIKDLRQNIKRVSSFCNEWWNTFPKRNCSFVH